MISRNDGLNLFDEFFKDPFFILLTQKVMINRCEPIFTRRMDVTA